MVACWSASLQAFWTQGVTAPKRASDLPHWHLKSVRSQPLEPRGPRKQLKAQEGMFSSWAEATAARARAAKAVKDFIVRIEGGLRRVTSE